MGGTTRVLRESERAPGTGSPATLIIRVYVHPSQVSDKGTASRAIQSANQCQIGTSRASDVMIILHIVVSSRSTHTATGRLVARDRIPAECTYTLQGKRGSVVLHSSRQERVAHWSYKTTAHAHRWPILRRARGQLATSTAAPSARRWRWLHGGCWRRACP